MWCCGSLLDKLYKLINVYSNKSKNIPADEGSEFYNDKFEATLNINKSTLQENFLNFLLAF